MGSSILSGRLKEEKGKQSQTLYEKQIWRVFWRTNKEGRRRSVGQAGRCLKTPQGEVWGEQVGGGKVEREHRQEIKPKSAA